MLSKVSEGSRGELFLLEGLGGSDKGASHLTEIREMDGGRGWDTWDDYVSDSPLIFPSHSIIQTLRNIALTRL